MLHQQQHHTGLIVPPQTAGMLGATTPNTTGATSTSSASGANYFYRTTAATPFQAFAQKQNSRLAALKAQSKRNSNTLKLLQAPSYVPQPTSSSVDPGFVGEDHGAVAEVERNGSKLSSQLNNPHPKKLNEELARENQSLKNLLCSWQNAYQQLEEAYEESEKDKQLLLESCKAQIQETRTACLDQLSDLQKGNDELRKELLDCRARLHEQVQEHGRTTRTNRELTNVLQDVRREMQALLLVNNNGDEGPTVPGGGTFAADSTVGHVNMNLDLLPDAAVRTPGPAQQVFQFYQEQTRPEQSYLGVLQEDSDLDVPGGVEASLQHFLQVEERLDENQKHLPEILHRATTRGHDSCEEFDAADEIEEIFLKNSARGRSKNGSSSSCATSSSRTCNRRHGKPAAMCPKMNEILFTRNLDVEAQQEEDECAVDGSSAEQRNKNNSKKTLNPERKSAAVRLELTTGCNLLPRSGRSTSSSTLSTPVFPRRRDSSAARENLLRKLLADGS
ncbi:unnamed protein product [Amoebophrya sp. A120]|nr:unnamed protein product [Amoebophrya sp. A120]|eukprot:GSA120T00009139001.1